MSLVRRGLLLWEESQKSLTQVHNVASVAKALVQKEIKITIFI